MIVSITRNGKETLIKTNAPVELLVKHFSTEYLCNSDILEYISENNYEYEVVGIELSLNYDL